MQAFLQRVINGGGNIAREVAAGNGRIDLCVEYQDASYPIELKIRYDNDTLQEGLTQLSGYMDKLGEKQGWLCLFDRSPEKSWDEKIYQKTEIVDGKTVFVFGL
jgi:hypothetical protein